MFLENYSTDIDEILNIVSRYIKIRNERSIKKIIIEIFIFFAKKPL